MQEKAITVMICPQCNIWRRWENIMVIYITRDVDHDHLGEVVSTGFLHCEVTFSSLMIT